jgi:hypothetical protein
VAQMRRFHHAAGLVTGTSVGTDRRGDQLGVETELGAAFDPVEAVSSPPDCACTLRIDMLTNGEIETEDPASPATWVPQPDRCQTAGR